MVLEKSKADAAVESITNLDVRNGKMTRQRADEVKEKASLVAKGWMVEQESKDINIKMDNAIKLSK